MKASKKSVTSNMVLVPIEESIFNKCKECALCINIVLCKEKESCKLEEGLVYKNKETI